MIVKRSSNFKKQFRKLPEKIQKQATERLLLFSRNKMHPILRNHKLKGKYSGYRSINITGDIRAIYKDLNENSVLFVAIGTHAELYR